MATTLHVIGDAHIGANPQWRLDAVVDDLASPDLPSVAARVQLGDLTDAGWEEQMVQARDWLGRLPGDVHPVIGNHDVIFSSSTRWAEFYGRPGHNYTVAVGDLTLVVLGIPAPEATGLNHPTWVDADGLAFLDHALADAPGDVVVASHCPLGRTVGGEEALHFTSYEPGFAMEQTDDLVAVVAKHGNVVAWLSGHTHSPVDVAGFVTSVDTGGRPLVAVNASSIYYTGRTVEESAPVVTLFVTVDGGAVSVRCRDHVARSWIGNALVAAAR
jgi:3',5'-cyclic AMP phosphodiesterase CpdA